MMQDEVYPPTSTAALNSVAGLLLVACVFAGVGGYMDAYAYIAHGHVFATAQTGNVVLLGVYVSGRDWVQAARHLHGTSGLVLWLIGRRPEENRNRAIVSSSVFASFAIGACLGGLYTRFDGKHSLALCIPLVLVGLVLTWRQRIHYQRRDHELEATIHP